MDFIKAFLFLLSILSIQKGYTQVGNYIPEFPVEECSHQKKGSPLQIQENQFTRNYDITYYRLNLTVTPDSQFVSGSVTSHFIPLHALNQIYFELNPTLEVDSIQYHNQSALFTQIDQLIQVNAHYDSLILDSLTIFYHGTPPEGASFKTELHNQTPILWTLSEPYGAIDWWPCKQSLTDKADSVDMYITCPKENKVAGNGILQSVITHGDFSTTHWKSRYPIAPYLIAMAVTPYAEINFTSHLSTGSLLVQNYVYKEDSARYRNDLFITDTLLRYYDSLVGPYPFMNEKYGHAQWGRGGGMEHQTMSFMHHFQFNLNAHELAHQWFGNKITCGSWQDIWLNEGFATYFAGLPLETMYHGKYWEEWKSNTLKHALANNSLSIFVMDTSTFQRIFDPELSYAKAAYVLHMLRGQVGDHHFFNGIRTYLSDPDLAYQTALTDDFFKHMEQASGTSLTSFKEQWIYGIGYPNFNIEWDQINSQLEIRLRQTTSNSTPSFFNLSVPILVLGESDSTWVSAHALQNEDFFYWDINFEVTQVIIDPNKDLISKGNFVLRKSKFSELTLFPNPTSHTLQIVLQAEFRIIDGYRIYSSTGILLQSLSDIRLANSFEIDVSHLSQGSYQIQFTSGQNKHSEGFVIIR